MTNSTSDVPPVWVPRFKSQNPMRIARTLRLGPEGTVDPDHGAVFLLIGRPDDTGREPVEVVSFEANQAEELGLSLIRAAAEVRRAR